MKSTQKFIIHTLALSLLLCLQQTLQAPLSYAKSKKIKSSRAESSNSDASAEKKSDSKEAKDTKEAIDPKEPLAAKDLTSIDGLTRWMTFYYLRPQPELIVPALLLADKLELLQGESAPPLQAFSSRVFAANPDKIKDWFLQLSSMSDAGKNAILSSIWWANKQEGKDLLLTIAANLPEKPQKEFRKQIDKTPPEIDQMDIESPDVLDMLWGAFSATGDERYVKRLAGTLAWGKSENKDLSRMLIASAARWSLLSNIQQHQKVKEICLSLEANDQDLKPYLAKLLSEAESGKKENKEPDKEEAKSTDTNKTASDQKANSKEAPAKKDLASTAEKGTEDSSDASLQNKDKNPG